MRALRNTAVITLVIIFLLLSCSPTVFARGTTSYYLKEVDVSISIPSEYMVLMKDSEKNNQDSSTQDASYEEMKKLLDSTNSYLLAANKDLDYLIQVKVDKSFFSDLPDFSQIEEDNEYLSMLKTTLQNSIKNDGGKVTESDYYFQNQTKFIKLKYSFPFSESPMHYVLYYTIVSDQRIIQFVLVSSNLITATQEQDLKSIVDSFSFGPVVNANQSSTYKAFSNNTSSIIVGLILTIALYSLPIIIYRYAIKRSPVEKKKAKKITIIYGIAAFTLMSVLLFVTNESVASGSPILIWSWINYKMLTGGKTSTPDDTGGISADEKQTMLVTDNPTTMNNDSGSIPIVKTVSQTQPEGPKTQSSHGIIYDVVLDDGSSAVMDEKELKEYATRKKTLQEGTIEQKRIPIEEIKEKEPREQILFCRECGKKIAPNAAFCPECGTKVISLTMLVNEQIPQQVIPHVTKDGEAESGSEENKSFALDFDYFKKSLSPTLRRGFILTEDEEWEKADNYFEKVLDEEPENAYAYLGKLLVEKRVTTIEKLKAFSELETNKLYIRTLQFADDELKKLLIQ